jgi:hypothetical protein
MKTKESPEVWTEPELIVLVRNKPEEAVLTNCKGNGTPVVTTWAQENGCHWYDVVPCENLCEVEVTS